MKNKTLAIIIVLLGVIAIFAKQDYAWVLSAIMIGIFLEVGYISGGNNYSILS